MIQQWLANGRPFHRPPIFRPVCHPTARPSACCRSPSAIRTPWSSTCAAGRPEAGLGATGRTGPMGTTVVRGGVGYPRSRVETRARRLRRAVLKDEASVRLSRRIAPQARRAGASAPELTGMTGELLNRLHRHSSLLNSSMVSPASRTIPPIVYGFRGSPRGIVMMRVPSVITTWRPWRATRKPHFSRARTASR
jgi:hypothetical protein